MDKHSAIQRGDVLPHLSPFGTDPGDRAAILRSLAWWQAHPRLAATRRGQQRIATLQRDLDALPATFF